MQAIYNKEIYNNLSPVSENLSPVSETKLSETKLSETKLSENSLIDTVRSEPFLALGAILLIYVCLSVFRRWQKAQRIKQVQTDKGEQPSIRQHQIKAIFVGGFIIALVLLTVLENFQ